MTKHKRKIKLIKPGLQLRLTMVFVGLVSLSLLLQFLLFMQSIMSTANALPNDGAYLLELSDGLLLRVLGLSFLVFLPLTYAVGVLTTFRVAGPIHRFEKFFSQILDGEKPKGFELRSGDELQDLARLINSASEYLKREAETERDLAQSSTGASSSASESEASPRKSA